MLNLTSVMQVVTTHVLFCLNLDAEVVDSKDVPQKCVGLVQNQLVKNAFGLLRNHQVHRDSALAV